VSLPARTDFDTVELHEASRHYGRRRALARTSLTFRRGEIAGLFGPNGAGKSTMLALLSTLMRPTQGHVHFGGQPASVWGDSLRSRLGMLGHDLFLYSDLTARENLAFFGRLYQLTDLDARIDRALDAARLSDRADDRVGGFSRGLRQRLALERALLHEPRLVLLDEPFTGLDDESAALLGARLRDLRARGAIVIMATHDFEIATDLVDRMICLRNGRVLETPGAGPLRDRYRAAMAEAWT
jgi:ABC-type multidrug transport system ATPase subunit